MSRKKPVILISNDDGCSAEGLLILHRALDWIADTVVVSPDRERSAISHALTLHRPLRVYSNEHGFYCLDGTPADCITFALRSGRFPAPQVIVAGINRGPNLGEDVLYSGTVAAATEGAMRGVPSIAVSLAVFPVTEGPFYFNTAADVVLKVVQSVLKNGLPYGTILNINVPNIPVEELKGIRVTRQGHRRYEESIVEKEDPRGASYYWIGGGIPEFDNTEDTDGWAVENGYASVTPLSVDMTARDLLEEISSWTW